ncbi:MAG: SufD family Fe-S cluster assembly protein [Candidatus Pacebacteria bacterium]|nr:SufD family Fe-S cluster assembly protein [Candidatus Paceibacterota bacterium]MDD3919358.1 SufD family Fe-S cluster assembly protein [Candidatus Paceibacterota bacterium]
MILKSAKNVPNFYQIDNRIEKAEGLDGVIILPSFLAWEKFKWTHEYFGKKPKQGFFLWIQKSVSQRLNTLVEIQSKNILQEMSNLIFVEKGLKVELSSLCQSTNAVKGKHLALAKIVIKENSFVNYFQKNSWKKEDDFKAHYQFFLEKNAKLKTSIVNQSSGAKVSTREDVYLRGKKSSADLRIKMMAENGGVFNSESFMYGEDEVRGHLECSGLIVDKKSQITSIPGIVCSSNRAELTHEASIGKISEEKLMYLRMRGLSEKKATELIIKSFLDS